MFPAFAGLLCRKRHPALRLDGLIPAYKGLTVHRSYVLHGNDIPTKLVSFDLNNERVVRVRYRLLQPTTPYL